DKSDSGVVEELYANVRARSDGTEVVNKLREVLNTVNVVMRRRRNQRRAWRGMPDARDVFADFLRRQLAAFAWFRTLRHFDFEFFGVDEIVVVAAEASGADLLNFVGSGR